MILNEKEILATRDDSRFRDACSSYGIFPYDLLLCNDAAVLKSPREGFYIFLDRDSYSTMGIERIPASRTNVDLEQDSATYKSLFNITSEDMKMVLPYPFQEMTLKQLTDLTDRVEVVDRNYGYSYDLIVNEKRVEDKESDDSILLGAAKYLTAKADEYWHNTYRAMLLQQQEEHGVGSIYKYLGDVVRSLNEFVGLCIKDGRAPRINEAAAYIGDGSKEVDIYASELYCMLRVLLRSRGYDFETLDTVREIPEEEGKDFDQRAMKLLKILDIPRSEMVRRTQSLDKGLYRHKGSLREFFEVHVAKPNAALTKSANIASNKRNDKARAKNGQ